MATPGPPVAQVKNFGVSLTSLVYPLPNKPMIWWFFQNTSTSNYFLLSLLPAPTLDHCISHQIINTVFSLAFLHPQMFPRSLFLTARVFLLKLELNRSHIYSIPPVSSPFNQSKKLWSLQWPTKTKWCHLLYFDLIFSSSPLCSFYSKYLGCWFNMSCLPPRLCACCSLSLECFFLKWWRRVSFFYPLQLFTFMSIKCSMSSLSKTDLYSHYPTSPSSILFTYLLLLPLVH